MSRKLLLVTLFLQLASVSSQSQELRPTGSLTYKPPIIPLIFSLNDNGRVSVRVSDQIDTLIGTFGVGAGVQDIESKDNTYFIIRHLGRDSIYCIGKSGKIRLRTKGESVVEITMLSGYQNVYILNINRLSGDFKAEFIPDSDSKELARIKLSIFEHIVLTTKGDIVSDQYSDTTFPLGDIDELILAEYGDGNYRLTLYEKSGRWQRWDIPKSDWPAVAWLGFCLQKIAPSKYREITMIKKFDASISIARGMEVSTSGSGKPLPNLKFNERYQNEYLQVYSDGSIMINCLTRLRDNFIRSSDIDKVLSGDGDSTKVTIVFTELCICPHRHIVTLALDLRTSRKDQTNFPGLKR